MATLCAEIAEALGTLARPLRRQRGAATYWRRLGFACRSAYCEWCEDCGFEPHTNKPPVRRRIGRDHARFLRRARLLPDARFRSVLALLKVAGETPAAVPDADAAEAKLRRLLHAAAMTRVSREADRLEAAFGVFASLTRSGEALARPPESWKVPDAPAATQLESLLRHVYVRYGVPPWALSFARSGDEADLHVFLALAAGRSVRDCGLPVRLSKAEARLAMAAPGRLGARQAARWARCRAAGMTRAHVADVLRTPLGDSFAWPRAGAEAFWAGVFAWLGRHREFGDVRTLIEWAAAARFGANVTGGGGVPRAVAAWKAGLSMAGRTPRSIGRELTAWDDYRRRLRSAGQLSVATDAESVVVRAAGTPLRFTRLRTGEDLLNEGRRMRHCIGDYAGELKDHQFWSVHQDGRPAASSQRLTLRVCGTWVEASGFANREPTDAEWTALREWGRRRPEPVTDFECAS